jgi:hypothetical protein
MNIHLKPAKIKVNVELIRGDENSIFYVDNHLSFKFKLAFNSALLATGVEPSLNFGC